MRDFYLLAAGLLTGVVIPASTFPQMSIIQAKNDGVLWNLKDSVHITVSENIVPNFDISVPKFTNQGLQQPVHSQSFLNPSTQPALNRPLVSGRQLYQQRLADLQASQPNTGLPENSLKSLMVSANKSQLTYEDWKNLLAMEAKAMAQAQGFNSLGILVGDSLSLWFPQQKLPSTRLWLNQGISGDTSHGIFKRLSAFSKTRPDVIYVMAGINDLRKGAKDETILNNYRRIIRNLRKTHPNTKILIQSILPTRLPTISNNRIRIINHQLALIAQKEGAYYLNLYQWFTDFHGNLRPELTTDGLHLSREGYDVWQSALHQVEFRLNANLPVDTHPTKL